jgi:hypothetical protein
MKYVLWTAYLSAVALTVMVKLLRYMHSQSPADGTLKASLQDYFVGSQSTTITSISVVGFELLLGAVVCDQLPVFGDTAASLPQHWALAFFIGSLAEGLAPLGISWVSKRLFP